MKKQYKVDNPNVKYKVWCVDGNEFNFVNMLFNDRGMNNAVGRRIPCGIYFGEHGCEKCVYDLTRFRSDNIEEVDLISLNVCIDKLIDERNNPVNHPTHYASTKVECIDAMEQVFGREAVVNFALLNCFKYLWRRKDKDNEEQDIQKACWYFDKAKELINKDV